MDSAGLCDECGRVENLFSCGLCGARVCTGCVTVQGICKKCVGGRKVDGDKARITGILAEKGLRAKL